MLFVSWAAWYRCGKSSRTQRRADGDHNRSREHQDKIYDDEEDDGDDDEENDWMRKFYEDYRDCDYDDDFDYDDDLMVHYSELRNVPLQFQIFDLTP